MIRPLAFWFSLILLPGFPIATGEAAPRVLDAWQPAEGWRETGPVALDPADNGKFLSTDGTGVLLAGGKAAYLHGEQPHGDAEIHVEFNIPARSNSGVYVMGSYEVQIYDSHGVAKDQYPGIECGGIYPEWVGNANVRGHSPAVNASLPPGAWQSFDIVFRGPRFDSSGRKTANARFEKVIHNGKTVHENVELLGPTRGGLPEAALGPLRLQGDHGVVAFRNVRIKPLDAGFSWDQSPTSLALRNGEKTVWRLVFDPKEPKSYFHPLATVDGEELTALRPKDHVWHRGLWFSWKIINGLNYWEEDPETGASQGLSEIIGTKITANPDFSAAVTLDFSYHPPDKPGILTEQRFLTVSAPDKHGCYRIDWTSIFTAGTETVVLDRTPPSHVGGVAWGGYAGLSLRFPPGIQGRNFTTSAGVTTAGDGNGKSARWADFSGPTAGIAIFDHPENPRHPAPWYLNEQLPFFSPALLFNEPLTLAPGKSLTLRYRVLVHRGAAVTDLSSHDWQSP